MDGVPIPDSTAPRDWIDRRGTLLATAVFLATRAMVWIAVLTTSYDGRFRPGQPGWPDWWSPVPLQRWDAGHYQYIATYGYPTNIVDTTAFLPAYPITAWPLTRWMQPDIAMVVMASVQSFLAVLIFFWWSRYVAGTRTALIATALLSSYPPAMFFSAGYPEGLRLICLGLMLWCRSRGRWWTGALPGAVLTATHPTGIAIAAAYCAWGLFEGIGRPLTRDLPIVLRRAPRFMAVGLICGLGLVAHATYLRAHYGRDDAFLAAQRTWKSNPAERKLSYLLTLKPVLEPSFAPIKHAARGHWHKLAEPITWNRLLNLLILIVAVAGLARPGAIPRLSFLVPIFVFLIGYLADPFNGTRLEGISRYQLAALPCFLWLAQCRAIRSRPTCMYGLIAGLVVLQVLYVRAYVRWELAS